jgi:hypothetical protein
MKSTLKHGLRMTGMLLAGVMLLGPAHAQTDTAEAAPGTEQQELRPCDLERQAELKMQGKDPNTPNDYQWGIDPCERNELEEKYKPLEPEVLGEGKRNKEIKVQVIPE